MWLRALRSFFNAANHPLTEAERAGLGERSFNCETGVVRDALVRCLHFSRPHARRLARGRAEEGVAPFRTRRPPPRSASSCEGVVAPSPRSSMTCPAERRAVDRLGRLRPLFEPGQRPRRELRPRRPRAHPRRGPRGRRAGCTSTVGHRTPYSEDLAKTSRICQPSRGCSRCCLRRSLAEGRRAAQAPCCVSRGSKRGDSRSLTSSRGSRCASRASGARSEILDGRPPLWRLSCEGVDRADGTLLRAPPPQLSEGRERDCLLRDCYQQSVVALARASAGAGMRVLFHSSAKLEQSLECGPAVEARHAVARASATARAARDPRARSPERIRRRPPSLHDVQGLGALELFTGNLLSRDAGRCAELHRFEAYLETSSQVTMLAVSPTAPSTEVARLLNPHNSARGMLANDLAEEAEGGARPLSSAVCEERLGDE